MRTSHNIVGLGSCDIGSDIHLVPRLKTSPQSSTPPQFGAPIDLSGCYFQGTERGSGGEHTGSDVVTIGRSEQRAVDGRGVEGRQCE